MPIFPVPGCILERLSTPVVFFDYEMVHAQSMTDPFSPAEVAVTSVIIGEAEFFELDDLFLPAVLQRLEELAFEHIESFR